MGPISITTLIEKSENVIATYGYKSSTIRHYNDHWSALKIFFLSYNQTFFSMELSDEFLSLQEKRAANDLMSKSNFRGIRRAIHLLQQCYIYSENIKWQRFQTHIVDLNDEAMLLCLYEKYRLYISSTLSTGSVKVYCRIVESFLVYLKGRMINCITNTTQLDIRDFIELSSKAHPKGMHVVLPGLRSFLRFVIEENPSMEFLLWAVPSNATRKPHLISALTDQELQELDNYIQQKNPSSKRNYAIFLIASRMGLRKSDIAGLKLCDVDWHNNTIKIIQQKNSQELTIPLIKNVGNAIADYILNERPDSKSVYIFLRYLAPYEKISSATCTGIIHLAMKHCSIHEEDGMSQGIHCLRHTVAQRMLSKSVPLPIISSILGHKDKSSTKRYLSIDTKTLRFCALSLSGIEVSKEELL